MKVNTFIAGLLVVAVISLGMLPGVGHGAISAGSQVPVFTLKDINGKAYPLSGMQNTAMTILYFFDADSRPSIEGLMSLDRLARQYRDADLTVWAITRSPKQKVAGFLEQTQTVFPVLLDRAGVSEMYDAQRVLPTVCIVGPELKMLDFFQGGREDHPGDAGQIGRTQPATKKTRDCQGHYRIGRKIRPWKCPGPDCQGLCCHPGRTPG